MLYADGILGPIKQVFTREKQGCPNPKKLEAHNMPLYESDLTLPQQWQIYSWLNRGQLSNYSLSPSIPLQFP